MNIKQITIILASIMTTLFITQISVYAFTPGTACEGAPFVWPTWGKQGALWRFYSGNIEYVGDDGFHDGIDIGQVNGQENVEPVYAVCNGSLQPYTTTAFLIQCDPIDSSFQVPHNQVWIYYTHMGNYSGSVSYVLSEFHPGNPTSRVTPGQLLGYQGIKGTTFVHLHLSVNTCASESCNIDPSPYFGDNLDNTQVNPTRATPPFNCHTVVISEGCTDPNAINYDPDATVDNRSCQYPRKPTLAVLGDRLYQAVIRRDGNVATRYSFDGVHWAEWDEYGVAQGSASMIVYNSKVFQAVIKTDERIFTRIIDEDVWEQNGEARGHVEMATFNGRLYQSVIQNDGDVYI
ncbi:hypothetical protein ANT_29790 [Candidatus Vecturithrix granuli]|uniref:Uncharacterized protein n=1 Tax=Vecturithrix granuli TaxID=1499967 RepID=A0A081C1E4_VECG1|nr:hypothetical protein ANT_29790 [Candidatus Vecturithrix granuli]